MKYLLWYAFLLFVINKFNGTVPVFKYRLLVKDLLGGACDKYSAVLHISWPVPEQAQLWLWPLSQASIWALMALGTDAPGTNDTESQFKSRSALSAHISQRLCVSHSCTSLDFLTESHRLFLGIRRRSHCYILVFKKDVVWENLQCCIVTT